MRKSWFFLFRQTSTFAISASFEDMIMIQKSKSFYFNWSFRIWNFFWRARTPARAARHDKCSKNFIVLSFFRVREAARTFGARHRIENHQSNILCTYNMFISSKLAEIERFEIFFGSHILLQIHKKNFQIEFWNLKIWFFNFLPNFNIRYLCEF